MMYKDLNFPEGEFTHTMLAQHNNKTNQSVWVRYQEAIKRGIIVFVGERSINGKGKPSKFWKLADATTLASIDLNKPIEDKKVDSNVVELKPVKSKPVEQPIVNVVNVSNTPTVVEEIKPVVITQPDVNKEVVNATVNSDPVVLNDMVCPICKNNVLAMKDATGYVVWCNKPIEVCSSTENPFGHGKTIKDAYEVMNQKWNFRK